MYRIAVIQNEVEMQHSGYVDAVYKAREKDWVNTGYNLHRFSSVNISQLFNIGENYLLDFDCLIIGTNATSDSGVYGILQDENNKNILEEFIMKGKGLLICSQKKLNPVMGDNLDKTLRQTCFMPPDYEYQVISRPKEENSSDGFVALYDKEKEVIQNILQTYPHSIKDERINRKCENNGFQKHYYRDYIKQKQVSKYLPILVDNNRGSERNLLMVANPKKNERIVVSTMALDWAGHFELIENILYYLLEGIPTVAIINSGENDNHKLKDLLAVEAGINNISYKEYKSVEELDEGELKQYHSIYVFMPGHDEKAVINYWKELNKLNDKKKRYKFLYYKKEGSDFVLEYLSNFGYLDWQKDDICDWLKKEFKDGFWGNSFWKTHDVLFSLHNIGESIIHYLKKTFSKIDSHYNKGSYDGVLAPTCGLLELESLICSVPEYKTEVQNIESKLTETKNWLKNKFEEQIDSSNPDYKKAFDYNKKFIIRSFFYSNCYDDLAFSGQKITSMLSSVEDSEIDLCLDIEVLLICRNEIENYERDDYDSKIIERIEKLVEKQTDHNGKWDNNLGKTARIVLFLQKIKKRIEAIDDFKKQRKKDLSEKISKAISRGIIALKSSYNKYNWEENVVTTANAITALYENDADDGFALQDLARQFGQETTIFDSYESLRMSLATIDRLNKENGVVKEENEQVKKENHKLIELEDQNTKLNKRYHNLFSITVFFAILIIGLILIISSSYVPILKDVVKVSYTVVSILFGILLRSLIHNPLEFIRNIKDFFVNVK